MPVNFSLLVQGGLEIHIESTNHYDCLKAIANNHKHEQKKQNQEVRRSNLWHYIPDDGLSLTSRQPVALWMRDTGEPH